MYLSFTPRVAWVDFYENTRQRKLAQEAPFAKAPTKLSTSPRWGTAWCWTDPEYEAVLPIDDSDMGCSCKGEKCEIREAWSRQIDLIELKEGDALTEQRAGDLQSPRRERDRQCHPVRSAPEYVCFGAPFRDTADGQAEQKCRPDARYD